MVANGYEFGDWLVEPGLNRVSRGELVRQLEPQCTDVLRYLLDHPNQTVSTEELLDAVWAGRIVEPAAVHRGISHIRRALRDDPQHPRYIETVPKRGYRAIASVEPVGEPAGKPAELQAATPRLPWLPSRGWLLAGTAAVLLLLPAVLHPDTIVLAFVLNAPQLVFGRAIEQELGFAMSEDGTRIAYATSGAGSPIVYVLSIGTHLENGQSSPFNDNEGLLALSSRNHFFVRYDGRGFGLSDRDVADFSLEARVSDLAAVVDAVGLDRFAVLAASGGGPQAIAYTARHPDRVTRLVLAGTVASYHWMQGEERDSYAQVLDRRFLGEMIRRAGNGRSYARFLRSGLEIDVRHDAQRISVPTLVIHGRDDIAVPLEAGRELAALIPGARFEVVEGGHMASSASTASVRRRALEFLASGA
jgi:pimeloyl-ACP methyl ester carboxylesterase/DNA-binding winged helix-turn-helix (wHTH) protein